ncbi:hypothetical protein GCM10008967_29480 [Bacillus carboniphilus]|uniref:DnaB/C C-terminal domain-containing protein n=1 Tax=Bacillus carboniphilus TaxID=86663 RepID=A0ABN0WH49_9BACI
MIRIIKKLEKLGYLISQNLNKKSFDNTKWYTLNVDLLEEGKASGGKPTPLPIQSDQLSNQDDQTASQNDHATCSSLIDDVCNMNRPIPENTTEITTEIKEEEEEDDTCADQSNPFQFFKQNGFGTIGNYIAEKIQEWCEALSDELVLEAMKIATEDGAKSWCYVESILHNWVDKGVSSLAEAEAFQLWYKEKKSTQLRIHSCRKEPIPEWFESEKKRRQQSFQRQVEETFDFEEERRMLEIELGRRHNS